MSSRTLIEKNRRFPNLRKSKITEVLPEYFGESYPNLIAFLDEYYEAMDQEGELTDTLEYGLVSLRDIDEISLQYMDRLFFEIGNGAAKDYFSDPRFAAKVISFIIQNKGNTFSSQLFFRLFFNEEPEITFPKDNILYTFSGDSDRLGEAIIGPEGLRYMQDGAKFQILSILIKSGQSLDKWAELYKRFVHPAGWYLSSEIGTQGVAISPFSAASVINEVETTIQFELPATMDFGTPYPEITFLTDSGGTTFITSIHRTISYFADFTISFINSAYDDIFHSSQLVRFTFDDSSTSGGVQFDAAFETMDMDNYDSTW